MEERLNAMIDRHLETKGPVAIYQVACIEKPDISILDENFLKDMEKKKQHLIVEMPGLRFPGLSIGCICRLVHSGYVRLKHDVRAKFIDGIPFMKAFPSGIHQKI